MQKHHLFIAVIVVILLGGGAFIVARREAEAPLVVCSMEALICPDGSSVGRSGPDCAFSPCPLPAKEIEATTATLNQKILNNGVHITPRAVVNDSRCPLDVQCIQAGTVRVRVDLERNGKLGMETFTLGRPLVFVGKSITLSQVTPAPGTKQTIGNDDYRFEFTVVDAQ